MALNLFAKHLAMFCTIIPFDEPPPEDVANDDGPDAPSEELPAKITLRELWLVIWLAAICVWVALSAHWDDDPDGEPMPTPANDDYVDTRSTGTA